MASPRSRGIYYSLVSSNLFFDDSILLLLPLTIRSSIFSSFAVSFTPCPTMGGCFVSMLGDFSSICVPCDIRLLNFSSNCVTFIVETLVVYATMIWTVIRQSGTKKGHQASSRLT
ncbi:hypothetical protein F4808DRAFT_155882 [Astrocystis sublimbata]|nr:hypothetical protein F4808DRAFT_155882 [Astrocystis sublimbata]